MTRGSRLLLSLLALLLTLLVLGAVAFLLRDAQTPPTAVRARVPVPGFREVELPFRHLYSRERALPFAGGAVIDVDGDGLEELFLSGGPGQHDALFAFDGEGFVDITRGSGLADEERASSDGRLEDASYGAISLDVNRDGQVDLLVARESGVYLHENRAGRFESRRIETGLDDRGVALSLAPTDLDQDGWVDLFVCAFPRREHLEARSILLSGEKGAESRLLLNSGDNLFTDITESSGLPRMPRAVQAVWSDVDGDGDPDLIVAQATGHARTLRNLGGLGFEEVANPTTRALVHAMGIAIGDYDDDGLQDLFFSNTGSTWLVGSRHARSDRPLETDWILLRNRGDFTWFEEASQARLSDYELGRGAVFEDWNLDGLQDLVVVENSADHPIHRLFRLPGRFLVQNPDHTFAPVGREAGAQNFHYGVTPLVADWNRDGAPDLVYVNLGGPGRALLSESALGRYLRVDLGDAVASLGAVVEIETASGARRVAEVVGSEGLSGDQSHVVSFGLGDEGEALKRLEVRYLDGTVVTRSSVALDTTVRVARPSDR